MGKRMSMAAAADYCRRVGTSFRAGVDIVTLCQTEARRGDDRRRSVMQKVTEQVSGGSALAEAMVAADPDYFPRLLVSMVRLGEQTGRLERTLLQLADLYDHRLAVRRTFLMAIAWPALQLGAAIMVIGLLIWILGLLPKGPSGESFDPLRLGLKGTSGMLTYFAFVGLVAAAIALVVHAFRRNWFNLHALAPLSYMLPKVGPAIQTITLARFTWTLSMSLDAGLDPFRAIGLSMDGTGSDYYRGETETAQQAIRNGDSLAGALEKTEVFPDDFISSVEVAELAGTSAESLSHLAEQYDQRAKIAIRTIAGVATGVIWLSVVVILVFMILRLAMSVFGVYNEALEPI